MEQQDWVRLGLMTEDEVLVIHKVTETAEKAEVGSSVCMYMFAKV